MPVAQQQTMKFAVGPNACVQMVTTRRVVAAL